MKNTVGLFFGSFNPIHIGHLIIADFIQQTTNLKEVWFIVTPQSPFKQKDDLADDNLRYQMIEHAIEDFPDLKVSAIEFNLPQPNYTFNTLEVLDKEFPKIDFSLIMGSDNLDFLHVWKRAEDITQNYPIYVYPRGKTVSENLKVNVRDLKIVTAPLLDISATQIRDSIKKGILFKSMLPNKVDNFIKRKGLYQ